MPTQKREIWTETDLYNLPVGEHDYFERKSGIGFDAGTGEFLSTVAKAASAFLNSGGGHLVLGVADDGIPDGLPPKVGRTSIKEWLEQKIPTLLEYPPADFRVHRVIRNPNGSSIDHQKEVIVVDFGDSVYAPHQRKSDKVYFYRAAGRSERAPHFYLDLLRQRFAEAKLTVKIDSAEIIYVCEDEGLFVASKLNFHVTNVGNVAAYKWGLRYVQYSYPSQIDGNRDIVLERNKFPRKQGGIMNLRIDDTILPGFTLGESRDYGFRFRTEAKDRETLRNELTMFVEELGISCPLATETSAGVMQTFALKDFISIPGILDVLLRDMPNYLS